MLHKGEVHPDRKKLVIITQLLDNFLVVKKY